MIPNKDKLFADLDAMGEDTVRQKLAVGVFHKHKVKLVYEWLSQKARRDYLAQQHKLQAKEPNNLSKPKEPQPGCQSPEKPPNNIQSPRFRITPLRIVEGVIIGLLVIFILYIVFYYFHIDLTP